MMNSSASADLRNSTAQWHSHLHPLGPTPALQYFFVVCLTLQSIFGTLGNLLVIGAVCTVPALRTTGNAFIINLSLADLLVTCVTQPSSIIVVGTLCGMGCIASTWNICMISVNRFIMICYFERYDRIYTWIKTILMCVGVWLLIYLIEMPNHLGWGDTRFSVVFFVCTFANHVHSYALFYIGVGVCIPVFISFLSYLGIYLKVRNSSLVRNRILRKRNEINEKVTKPRQTRRQFHENVRVAKALFRVFVIFLIMWLPVAVLILMGMGTKVDYVWYILTVLMAHGNSSINCLVYALSLDHFREGYRKILGLGQATVHPERTRDEVATSTNLAPTGLSRMLRQQQSLALVTLDY